MRRRPLTYAFFSAVFLLSLPSFAGLNNYLGLGKIYHLEGNNQNFNITRIMAIDALKNAAASGDGKAMHEMGLIALREGNMEVAFNYFDRACGKYIKEACNNAGFIKHNNLENKVNPRIEEGLPYYEEALSLGDSYAVINLGRYHYNPAVGNYLLSYYYFELAETLFEEKKDELLITGLKKKAFAKLSPIEKKYAEKYYPSFLSEFAFNRVIGGRIVDSKVSMPPKKEDIKDNAPMLLRLGKNKDSLMVMLDWTDLKSGFAEIPAVPLAAADISDGGVISSLIYRYNSPHMISLALTEKASAIPMVLGDELKAYIYSRADSFDNSKIKVVFSSADAFLEIGYPHKVEEGWEVFHIKPLKKGDFLIYFSNGQKIILMVQ